jgi:hypothetical protein
MTGGGRRMIGGGGGRCLGGNRMGFLGSRTWSLLSHIYSIEDCRIVAVIGSVSFEMDRECLIVRVVKATEDKGLELFVLEEQTSLLVRGRGGRS